MANPQCPPASPRLAPPPNAGHGARARIGPSGSPSGSPAGGGVGIGSPPGALGDNDAFDPYDDTPVPSPHERSDAPPRWQHVARWEGRGGFGAGGAGSLDGSLDGAASDFGSAPPSESAASEASSSKDLVKQRVQRLIVERAAARREAGLLTADMAGGGKAGGGKA